MSGGLLQLIAYGAQDVYLTGNPQITFFKVVYRRYTNFAIETIEHPFVGEAGFGKSITAKISRNGDLVSKMLLRITVNSVDPNGTNFAWIRRLGHALIAQVEVDLGGTKIDRQYGTWMDIWYELTKVSSHDIGYDNMIGDVPILTNYDTTVKPEYTMYIPLQFWFNRYIGLSVPLIALQYHDMTIILDIAPANTVAIRDCNFDMTKVSINDATILVDYIYLDTDERRRFAQVGHEYLIEQIQWNGEERVQINVGNPTSTTNGTVRYRLDFNFPTKELFWAMKQGNYTVGNTFVYYTNSDSWSVADAACTIAVKSVSIGLNPQSIVGGTWFAVAANTTKQVGTFHVINHSAEIVYVNPTSLKIGNYGITSRIQADLTISQNLAVTCSNVSTLLTIRDISIPVKYMTDTRFNPCDPIVYMFNNYGILIDGTNNPVQYGLLQLNGHDRFDTREGAWFNYVQPEMHHSNTPPDGINVYSFSIFPEEHQPSGTANLSRIDTTDLILTFNESTATSTNPPLYFFNPDNRIYIYGMNYNILRIMSGLSGIAYSSV